jgi:hypothetical protein
LTRERLLQQLPEPLLVQSPGLVHGSPEGAGDRLLNPLLDALRLGAGVCRDLVGLKPLK